MDARFSPKTDQRAGVRPISFLLDNQGSLSDPVTLPVRPEDLTRNEPSRATVNQTLGRGVQGWVDNFGEGLPSVTIAGHTGWGYKPGLGRDGFQSFEALNEMVAHRYHQLKQEAIDSGRDPSGVKLLYVDLLDNFSWEVVPLQFVLRRSKSRPLLFQYNITLQALSTSVDGGLSRFLPDFGSPISGMTALGGVLGRINGLINSARGFILTHLREIATPVLKFTGLAVGTLKQVQAVIKNATGLVTGTTAAVVGIAKNIASVGREVFHTFAAMAGLGIAAKAAFSRVAAAFNEVVCIFSNSLRPRGTYEDYTGLYGASNCSSTTGGRAPSTYTDRNIFAELANEPKPPISVSGQALSNINAIKASDTALRPLPASEIGRLLTGINNGVVVAA